MAALYEIYDRFALIYEKNRGLFDMTHIFNDFFKILELSQGRLLDLGCGAGEPFSRMFIDKGWQVVGVDFSREMLKMASRYCPEMHTIYSDMRNAEFNDNEFNAIIAIYSLFHLPVKEHKNLFMKFFRWLKPHGKLLFTYATKDYTGYDEFDGCKEFMGQRLHYSHTTPEKLYKSLEKTGFEIISKDYRDIGGEIFLWITAGKK